MYVCMHTWIHRQSKYKANMNMSALLNLGGVIQHLYYSIFLNVQKCYVWKNWSWLNCNTNPCALSPFPPPQLLLREPLWKNLKLLENLWIPKEENGKSWKIGMVRNQYSRYRLHLIQPFFSCRKDESKRLVLGYTQIQKSFSPFAPFFPQLHEVLKTS